MSLYLHLVISLCPPHGLSIEMQSKSALAAHVIALYFNWYQEIHRTEVNKVLRHVLNNMHIHLEDSDRVALRRRRLYRLDSRIHCLHTYVFNMGKISISETSVVQPTSTRGVPFSLNRCESLKSVLCSFTCKILVLFPVHQQIAISDFCREI